MFMSTTKISPRARAAVALMAICCGFVTAAIAPPPHARAQPAKTPANKGPTAAEIQDLTAQMQQLMELFKAGKYAEGIVISKRVIAAMDRLGMGNLPMQAQNHISLGDLYRFNGQFAEAEQSLLTGLALIEKIHGKKHSDVVPALLGLHHLRMTQGRYREATALLSRAVAIREATLRPDDPELSWIRVTQAKLTLTVGRPDAAVGPLRSALNVFRLKLPPNHPYVGATLNNLSQALVALGNYAEAEPLLEDALAETTRVAGANSPLTAVTLNNLASLRRLQGRLPEAEDLHRRELAILEGAVGADSLELVASLGNYAIVLNELQRPREAEPLLRRALALQLKHLGPNHPDIATTNSNLAGVVSDDGRRDEARALLEQAVKLREAAFGPDTTEVANALINLAVVLFQLKDQSTALATARRALAIFERTLPPGHPSIATALNNVGTTLAEMGRPAEALPILERALAARMTNLGPRHLNVVLTRVNVATALLDLGRWQRAYDAAGEATTVLDSDLLDLISGVEAGDGMLARLRAAYLVRAVAAERLRAEPGANGAALDEQVFIALQRDQATITGAALQAASLRAATGDPALSRLVRERQDMTVQLRAQHALLIAALGRSAEERDRAIEAGITADVQTIAAAAKALDSRLDRQFPAYAALTRPAPMTLAEARAALPERDVLIVIAPSRLGALVFAVTRQEARLVRSNLAGAEIERMVSTLRCGLDAALWTTEATYTACLKHVRPPASGELPFDVATAYRLYKGLIGPVEDMIAGKRLQIVAGGPLTTLPFQVLVTTPPAAGADPVAALLQAAWLAKRHASSVLPSVDALRGLARTDQSATAAKPYLAVANPLLTGPDGTDRRAFDKQTCRATLTPQRLDLAARAARSGTVGATRAVPRPTLDIESLRRQTPLPETADEVCTVAQLLGAGEDDVLLGARATASEIAALAASGQLINYRVLHFASHGLVAGGNSDLEKGLPEPAILLTPPATGTTGTALARDNGLLAASDIAGLKLNADWVVLSACNTASGGRASAEALSGLARAFFYAGARGLLVSHWEVNSEAAVRLVTRAFEVWAVDPAQGRAGALAVAMAELLASTDPFTAHPAYWAPFVVVGTE